MEITFVKTLHYQSISQSTRIQWSRPLLLCPSWCTWGASQSISQSVYQFVNQSVNQSVIQTLGTRNLSISSDRLPQYLREEINWATNQSINQQLEFNDPGLFYRVLLHTLEPPGAAIADHGILPEGLASNRGALGSIPGRDMSILGPLVYEKITSVKSLHHQSINQNSMIPASLTVSFFMHLSRQSANQSVNQSVCQPVSESVNWPISRHPQSIYRLVRIAHSILKWGNKLSH